MDTRYREKTGRHHGQSRFNRIGSKRPGETVGKRKSGLPLNRLIPPEIVEGPKYYFIEAVMPGYEADDISVCLTSRIVTISGSPGSHGKSDRNAKKANFSLYLNSPVDPSFSIAHFSRGQFYMQMLKDPGAAVHKPVYLHVSG